MQRVGRTCSRSIIPLRPSCLPLAHLQSPLERYATCGPRLLWTAPGRAPCHSKNSAATSNLSTNRIERRNMSIALSAVSTNNAPGALGPYSQAIKAGPFVFLSGNIPAIPSSGDIVEGGIEAQTKQVLANMDAVLKAAGSNANRVVKTTVFLKNMSDFAVMNNVYGEYFSSNENKPARSTVEVARLPKDVLVEIECIATYE